MYSYICIPNKTHFDINNVSFYCTIYFHFWLVNGIESHLLDHDDSISKTLDI